MYNPQPIFCFAVALVCAAVPQWASADVTYFVTADTSSLLGQNGYLDLQFEPGPVGTNPANAVVTQFTTNGALSGPASLTGDVTGQLPATLSFDNQTVFNDYFQTVQFGTEEKFAVTLDGPNPTGGGPSAFNIAFYASNGSTPLLTVSPDGEVGQIVINSDGSTTPVAYAAAAGAGSVLSVNLVQSETVPEPAHLGWVGAAVGGVVALRIRRLSRP
jgi:hypothetical protein